MPAFIAFEILLWALFMLAIFDAHKRWGTKQSLVFFMPLFVYGWLLEASAIGLFQRYEYGTGFLITLFEAPLCIAAGWSAITYSGICIGKNLSDNHLNIALFTALWGLSMDFSMDGLAVVFGYWTWFAPENVVLPYFDVPVSNFIGWFIILSFYSYFHLEWQDSLIRKKLFGFDAVLPALPALLISIFIMIESEYERAFVTLQWWQMLLIIVLPCILLLTFLIMRKEADIKQQNKIPLFISHGFHGFFLIASIVVGVTQSDWRYLVAAIIALMPLLVISLPKNENPASHLKMSYLDTSELPK